MPNIIVETKNLVKTYGQEIKTYALDDVSLKIEEGEFLVILGSSGSGKSTLLNMIGGIDTVDSGSILFKGKDITKLKDKELTLYRRDSIGFVFQFFNLIDELNIYQNIVVTPGCKKNKQRIYPLLESMGLLEHRKKFPHELSGGQQQRVSIARALNKESEILLCDEPTGALDYQSGKDVLKIIEDINMIQKKTVILVTHTKEIAKMASHVIEMKNGKIVKEYYNEERVSSSEVDW